MSLPKKKKPPVNLPIVSVLLLIAVIGYSYFRTVTTKQGAPPSPVSSKSDSTVTLVKPVDLPSPALDSKTSVEKALKSRRSIRTFTDQSVSLKQLSQMLWAAQGVTADWGGRTTPSAKSAYPLTVYVLVSKVEGINPGLYTYLPGTTKPQHQLSLLKPGNLKEAFGTAIGQNSANLAPVSLIITGDFEKMATAFGGKRVDSNVYLEAGHSAQNLYLEAESLGLGMVTVAGFDQSKVREVIGTPQNEEIIYVIPFGYPKE